MDKSALITFNSSAFVRASLTSDKEAILNAVSTVTASGGTNANAGLSAGINELINNKSNSAQIVIMICDGDVNCTDSTINLAVENGIQVYTVNVINASNSKLENIAAKTGGEYYYAATSDEIGNIFDMIQSSTIVSDDKDHDGLKDIWETEGMQISNGTIIKTDPHNADTDGDGLNDGEEMGMYDEEYDYFPNYHSNPNDPDTDDDTLDDFEDPDSRYPFDRRFKIVDNVNYIPSVEYVDRHYDKGRECYYKRIANIKDVSKRLIFTAMLDDAAITPGLQFTLGSDEIKNYTEICALDFSKMMCHYLDCTGTVYYLDNDDMSGIIFSQNSNCEHLNYNIQQFKNAAEECVVDENELIISTRGENDFKVACYKSINCNSHFNRYKYDDSYSANWGYAIGEALGGMTGSVKLVNGVYYAKLNYYLIDIYDFPIHWNDTVRNDSLSTWAHELHECGLANEYKILGKYEMQFSWKKDDHSADNNLNIIIDNSAYKNEPYTKI